MFYAFTKPDVDMKDFIIVIIVIVIAQIGIVFWEDSWKNFNK